MIAGDDVSALDALEAEVNADAQPGFDVPLVDTTVRVKPVKAWPASNVRAIRDSDFDLWASKCLTEDSYEVWSELDPTYEQVEEFFAALNRATGQPLGKSQPSPRR